MKKFAMIMVVTALVVALGSTKVFSNPPGTLKWAFETGVGSPAIGADGTIYAGSGDGNLYAINFNGTLKWAFGVGGAIDSPPAVGADGTIYVARRWRGKLHAINPDGTLKWAFSVTYGIFCAPAIGADGTIYVLESVGRLHAINPDGTLKWIFGGMGGGNSAPAIGADGTIYVGLGNRNLYAINPDGTLKWAFGIGGVIPSPPAIDADGTIYVRSGDGYFYAINPDGTLKWKFPVGFSSLGAYSSSPTIGADGTIYVRGGNIYGKYLYSINSDGTLKWRYPVGAFYRSSPAIGADGTIYAGSTRNLYAVNPNGTLKWTFETESWFIPSPTIGADGTIYVGSRDKLYAIYSDSYGLTGSPWPMFQHDVRHTGYAGYTEFNGAEKSFTESTLVETLVGERAALENVTVTGDFNSILDFPNFEIVTVATGPFAGKGFSKGQWTTTLEGTSFTGDWKGILFLKPEERKIYLKGAISGEISATVEGYLTESVPESGIYDQYQATWKIGGPDTTTSATINLNGNLSYLSSSEFPATELYLLQTNLEGTISGDYAGSLSTVINHVRIADGDNPYYGEGFSIISYVSETGSGQGWTYDKLVSPGRVELKGLFSSPLFGIASGILDESELPRMLFLRLTRVDLGLPPAPDLKVKTWGPTRVSPGQTVNYMIEYRNDGLKAVEDIDVVMKLPYEVEFTSATSGGVYKEASHEIIWYIGNVPVKSSGHLSANLRVLWGLPLGTVIDWVVFAPRERIKVEVDPNICVDYEIIEANESLLNTNIALSEHNGPDYVIHVEINRQEVSELAAPTFEYIETVDGIRFNTKLTVEGSLWKVETVLKATQDAKTVLDLVTDFEDFITSAREGQVFLDCLETKGKISHEDSRMLADLYWGVMGMRALVSGLAPAIEKQLPFWGTILQKYIEKSLPGLEILVGAGIYKQTEGPLPEGWNRNREFVRQLKKLYDDAYRECLDEKSHDTDSSESEVNVARDPSVKYGPEGRVSPGHRLDYTVEYENEGTGIAFGVYFTDTLDEDLNDLTLEIGPVIDVNDGSIISEPGIYNPATRTITWFAGEVGPNEGGYADFSVDVKADANEGTEIINFATIYFPSVPEETKTNGIVSIVSLNQPPTADAGPDQSVEQESYDGTEVTLDGSGSTDPDSTPGTNDDIVYFDWFEIDTLLGSGETINYTFPLGTHTVTLVVTDSVDEADDDEVTVIVQDTTPPTINSISASPSVIWVPNHSMVEVTVTVDADDICDPVPVCSIVDVTSNEPINGPGDGNTEPDWGITGDLTVNLRAERAGSGTGRVYTIHIECTDASGNTAATTAEVTVPHDQGKGKK